MEQIMQDFCGVPVKTDMYDGIHLHLNHVLEKNEHKPECLVDNFQKNIDAALKTWIDSGIKCVWMHIPGVLSGVVPILFKRSFEFHHTKPDLIVMMKWICTTEPRRSPQFAHTMIGVGGLVFNPKSKKVLLIQEKKAAIKMWKFPGGYNEQNEDLAQTAIREVFEETGIETCFHSLITFRHRHRGAFECSDIYFVCLLCPKNLDTNVIHKCQMEIDDCAWFDLETASKELCGFNKYVFDCFVAQYDSILNAAKQSTSITINSEVIKCRYKHLEFDERVYAVGPVKSFD